MDLEAAARRLNDKGCRNKHKRFKTMDTKFNSLVPLGKSRYLCFDWDKCRYVVWDSKR